MFHPRVILHPTDFTEFSAYAFQIAVDLARQNEAALFVVHVAETLGPENLTYGEVATQLEPEGYHKRLFDDLRQTVPAPEGVEVHYVLAGGDPAREIARVAREHRCDLIVMGSHGHTGLSRFFSGSIAEEVVRLAPCPVLVAKWHQPDSAA